MTGEGKTVDELDRPVSGRELVEILFFAVNETIGHATLTAGAYQETLIEMANTFEAISRQHADARVSALLLGLSHKLMSTEPGAGDT